MKNFILSALIIFSTHAFGGISIVSDLDDTIKVTHSDDLSDSILNAVARRKVFVGMPEFLIESRSYVGRLNIVTSSPRIVRLNVKSLLKKHKIKFDKLVLNKNFKRPGHIEFKLAAIKKILDASTDHFILLGDDVGNDPEIYDQIMNLYPERFLASYIHIVNNRPVPESVKTYYTSYELAVQEHLAGRLSIESVSKIAKSYDQVKDFKGGFPDFAFCPAGKEYYAWLSDTVFSEEASPLIDRVTQYCQT